MTDAILIGTYSHGVIRQHRFMRGQVAVESTWARLSLPATPWFKEELAKAKVDMAPHAPWKAHGRSGKVVGLATIRPGMLDVGTLTFWSREAQLQRIYYRWPSDSFTVKIASFVMLDQPVEHVHRRDPSSVGGIAAALVAARHLLFCPQFVDEPSGYLLEGRQQTVQHFLHSSGIHVADVGELPCLMLPDLLVEFMRAKGLRELLLLGRWLMDLKKRGFALPFRGAWPPSEWLLARPEGHSLPLLSGNDAKPFGLVACQELGHLRKNNTVHRIFWSQDSNRQSHTFIEWFCSAV